MVEIDLITLIATLVAVFGGVGIAIAYIVKLSMRVKHLEEELKNNPIFSALRQIEREQIISIINDIIAFRLERRNG